MFPIFYSKPAYRSMYNVYTVRKERLLMEAKYTFISFLSIEGKFSEVFKVYRSSSLSSGWFVLMAAF